MKKKIKIIIAGTTAFLAVAGITLSVRTVPSGYTGVVVKFGEVQENTLNAGAHFAIPFITSVIKINNQVVRTDVDGESASKDLQTIQTTASINYRVLPDMSADTYKTIGEDVENIILRPAVQECVKSVISQYTAEELITKRQEVSAKINAAVNESVSPYGLSVEKVNILNLNFSAEFNAAIEAKQTAQQQALKAEQDLERVKIEAQQKVEEAKAEAEAYKLKNQEITGENIKMAWIEKWDGKLPSVQSGDNMLINPKIE